MHASLLNLPVSAYRDILSLQQEIVALQIGDEHPTPVLILVEHFPVFTLGNRGGKEHLKVSEEFLAAHHIELVTTKRGGFITYHCPGQLVAYLIAPLKKLQMTIPAFISGMEEVMLRTAADSGVTAWQNSEKRGVWVGERKLGSIGIALKRGITYHGLALNIAPDLTPFSWMQPCGLTCTEATSLAAESGDSQSMQEARQRMIDAFQKVFDLQMEEVPSETFWK